MMKNKIIKFKIIGVMAYFIIMLSANPQNLVLAGTDEKAREAIDNIDVKLTKNETKLIFLESEISGIKSENEKNCKRLQDEIEKINDSLKQVVFIEDNEKWKSEFARRLNGIEKRLGGIDNSIALLTQNMGLLGEKGVDIEEKLKTHSSDIKKIWPEVDKIRTKLEDIEKRLGDLEKHFNKVIPARSQSPEEYSESTPATSQIKEEDRGERELSFTAAHLIKIIIYIIIISIVILAIVALLFVLWFSRRPAFVFSWFKRCLESGKSGIDKDLNSGKKKKVDEFDSKCNAAVGNQGRQDERETITNKEFTEKRLIEWWNINVTKPKPFQEWEKLLKEEFGEGIIVELRKTDLIVIKEERSSKTCYLLPGNVKYTETIAKYFNDGSFQPDAEIVSLEKLPVGKFTPEGRYGSTTWTRGKVKLREEVDTNTPEEGPGSAKIGTEELHKENELQEKEVIKPTPFTKPFEKDLLVKWWNRDENGYKNGAKNLKDCGDSLKKEFGKNIDIDVISYNPRNTDDWYIIGIKESPESKLSYVIPRRYDFSKEMEKWFFAEKETTELKKMVSDLVFPAERDMGGNRKGMVRLR